MNMRLEHCSSDSYTRGAWCRSRTRDNWLAHIKEAQKASRVLSTCAAAAVKMPRFGWLVEIRKTAVRAFSSSNPSATN